MKSCFIFLGLVLFSFSVQAKVWTVSQTPGANFTTLSAAHSAAASGDTILVAGAPAAYTAIVFSKKLIVFGPGYFLNENTGLQANIYSAKFSGTTSFNSGSAGSIIMGLHFTGTVDINTNNITIRRNRIEITSSFIDAININTNLNDITIAQNYITMHSGGIRCIYVNTVDSNIIIKNNFLESTSGYGAIDASSAFTGEVFNNVISSSAAINIHSAAFNNNIIRNGGFNALGSTTPYNNIGNSTQFQTWTGQGNQVNINMTDVFVLTGSTDAQWQIKTSGPADGTGFGGTADCGMFDTSENNAYVLSGVPPIPSIYEFTANSDLSNVTVKAKSNN